jgi:hypothetical protein
MANNPYSNAANNSGGLSSKPLWQQYVQQLPPPYPTSYPAGIGETQSKHIHIDLGFIDWKDITIIKGNQKITVTPEELAIKLGLEW